MPIPNSITKTPHSQSTDGASCVADKPVNDSSTKKGIDCANITWRIDKDGRQIPVSSVFDDVYFSKSDGLAESNYVFLHANRLFDRWQNLKEQQSFTIIETGFGTGLNFLATCLLWQQYKQRKNTTHVNSDVSTFMRSATGTHLHFISTEKYPLDKADLTHALAIWQQNEPALSPFIQSLIEQYPLPMAGCHRLHFSLPADSPCDEEYCITLDLWLGDATDSLSELSKEHTPADAWYLDGFAPAKNQAMWSPALFDEIGRLSHEQTTLATFTAAGFVKRELIRIGANPKKIKGFGHKREMLTATFEYFCHHTDPKHSHQNVIDTDTVLTPNPKIKAVRKTSTDSTDSTANKLSENDLSLNKSIKHVAIIGAGVSGLCTAYALASAGVEVTLIDKHAPLAGASGNPRALFSPKLSQASTAHNHLPTVSHLYAERFYQRLNHLSSTPIFHQTGVIDFLEPHKKTYEKLASLVNSYPNELVAQTTHKPYNDSDADFAKHTITTHFTQGGLINPKLLADFILSHPRISFCRRHIDIDNLPSHSQINPPNKTNQSNGGDTANEPNKNVRAVDITIICAGFESHLLHADIFNCRKIRGQVSFMPLPQNLTSTLPYLPKPIKYEGYCAMFDEPSVSDEKQPTSVPYFLMGASFVRNDTATDIRQSEHQSNLHNFCKALPNLAQTLAIDDKTLQGRASIRAQTPDYHPILGRLDECTFVLTGMGSKGFSFAPLCGQILASLILKRPLPISQTLYAKLNPHRPRLQTPLNDNE